MDYRLYYTDGTTTRHLERINHICFGASKGCLEHLIGGNYVSGMGLYVRKTDEKVIRDIVEALNLADRTTYVTEGLAEGAVQHGCELLVVVDADGMDRLDYMRNMFILRDYAYGNTYHTLYKHSIDKGLTPRQSILLLSCLYISTSFGVPSSCATAIYSTRCFSNNITTVEDLKRFLENPQDAKGPRSGTFKDNPGWGYTSKGTIAFKRKLRKDIVRDVTQYGIAYSFCEMKSLKDYKEEREGHFLVPHNLYRELGLKSSNDSLWAQVSNKALNEFVRGLFDLPKDFVYLEPRK